MRCAAILAIYRARAAREIQAPFYNFTPGDAARLSFSRYCMVAGAAPARHRSVCAARARTH